MARKIRSTAVSRGPVAFGLSLAFAMALPVTSSPAAAAPSGVKSRASTAPVSARPARAPSGAASASTASASAAATPTHTKARARAKPKARAAAAGSPGATKPGVVSAASSPAEASVEAPGAKPAADVVKTEEAGAGEKTYTFGAQEVEGRLQSPQLLYFQRRVRAEFDPAPLGHRSFLLELSDTRRHPAFR